MTVEEALQKAKERKEMTIASAIAAERAYMSEAVGRAIGEYGAELFDEVETMIDDKIEQLRSDIVSMIATQTAMVLHQFAQLRADTDTKLASIRKESGNADASIITLPNPLCDQKAA